MFFSIPSRVSESISGCVSGFHLLTHSLIKASEGPLLSFQFCFESKVIQF